jgi:glycosyltransferase involved in cell wall biosynthesis
MLNRPKISVIIPIHDMQNGANFLWESINALMEQSFQDFEIVIVKEGKMAKNTNAGIKRARGELIKILYLDDRFAHKDALKDIIENFKGHWLITGVNDNVNPYYTNDIETGNNKLGSPSALTILNDNPLLFDENMSWLLDCDYYKRMYEKHGEPVILNGVNIFIGKGSHQMTNILTGEDKKLEEEYINKKYA